MTKRVVDPRQGGSVISWRDSLFETVESFPGDSMWADTLPQAPELPEVSDSDWQAFDSAVRGE